VLAAGRPVLFVGDAKAELARRIDGAGCGLAFSVGASAELATALRELAGHPEKVADMGTRARALWSACFQRKQSLAAWRAVLTKSPAVGT
jgi:hypothetical protein